MNVGFDIAGMVGNKIEKELLKSKDAKPIVELAIKYGIRGMQIVNFMADLATVSQQIGQMQQEEDSE